MAATPGQETKDTDLRLVKQLVPFILNVSHYLTDLVYTLYYLRNANEKKEEEQEQEQKTMDRLGKLQDELCKETLRLRGNFGSLLERISLDPVDEAVRDNPKEEKQCMNDNDTESDETRKTKRSGEEVAVQSIAETINYFKGLVNDRVINLTYKVNQSILDVIDNDDNDDNKDIEITDRKSLRPLATQLDNCMVGFTNLCNFVNQIPVRDATNTPSNGNHMQSILDVFQNELLSTWKVQLDLLNCKVFDLISGNPRIIKLFRESTGSKGEKEKKEESIGSTGTTANKPHTHVEGEDFIKLVNWLKDEQVFGKSSQRQTGPVL